MPIEFVISDWPEAPPTGVPKVHPTKETILATHLSMYVGIVGIVDDRNAVTLAAEPNMVTIENAGMTIGNVRWFKLSRPRGPDGSTITIKAKDARGTVVGSLKLNAGEVREGIGDVGGKACGDDFTAIGSASARGFLIIADGE